MSDFQDNRDWATQILDMYSEGNFDVEVAAKLNVPVKELYRQMDSNAGFKRLVEHGRTLCEAFWVNQARRNLNNKTFNATTWMFVMKNKFNWADKTEQLTTDAQGNVNVDELRQQLEREVGKYLKQYQPEMTDTRKALQAVNG